MTAGMNEHQEVAKTTLQLSRTSCWASFCTLDGFGETLARVYGLAKKQYVKPVPNHPTDEHAGRTTRDPRKALARIYATIDSS